MYRLLDASAQSRRLDKMAVTAAHRIAVNPFGSDLRPRASFQRLVNADNEWPVCYERRDEQAQQDPAGGER